MSAISDVASGLLGAVFKIPGAARVEGSSRIESSIGWSLISARKSVVCLDDIELDTRSLLQSGIELRIT